MYKAIMVSISILLFAGTSICVNGHVGQVAITGTFGFY